MNAAFIFSGQGAQFTGMGKDLYESSPAAKNIFDEADKILGWSVKEICFNGPDEKLTETRFCQPAIYTTSVAALEAFKEKFPSVKTAGTAGLSLGEYGALYGAGVISFAAGLSLLAKRAEFMDVACRESKGTMASVLGGEVEVIRAVCAECGIDVANYNCPGQVVISGEVSGVEKAIASLKEKGFRKVIPLKVAGAFHSRLMKSAGLKLKEVVDATEMKAPLCPIAQNVTGTVTGTVEAIKANLVEQVAGSVRWEECVKSLKDGGADTFIEFGPGNVLTGLLKRIDGTVPGFNIGKAADIAAFQA